VRFFPPEKNTGCDQNGIIVSYYMEYVTQHPLVQFALETSYNFKLLGWSEPAATNAPIED
jgi:hypothetical protein